jgi:hypothetical protein
MLLVFERTSAPNLGHCEPRDEVPGSRLKVVVVYTSDHATGTALERAATLAARLNADLALVVAQVVPYPLPLAEPPVPGEFSESRLREVAGRSPLPATVRIYLCRDRLEGLKAVLPPSSLVVVGGPRRSWPNPERRLARRLRRAGLDVVYTEE